VPSGSQAATEETRDLAEQIFETTDHLTVTHVNLVNAFTQNPEQIKASTTPQRSPAWKKGRSKFLQKGNRFFI